MPAWLQRDWCSSFVLALGHFVWRGTSIALVLAIALRATKTVSVRYWLSLAALLVMAVSPVVTLGWLLRPVSHVAMLDNPPLLAEVCDGDARRALNALEIAVLSVATHQHDAPASGRSGNDADHSLARRASDNTVDLLVAQEFIQKKAVQYCDDEHYDAASAFIKSIRGSDPDAAIYWLARMLEAGEEPRFIARRIVIAASEDIGNADPQALVVAMAAAHATEFVGLPECRIMLAQAVTYLATAPKSNASYLAVDAALDDVRTKRVLPVPTHLRDGHYPGAKRLGHGEGYQYAHDAPEGWVDQDYLGVERTYYQPVDRGFEAELKRRVEEQRARRERPSDAT